MREVHNFAQQPFEELADTLMPETNYSAAETPEPFAEHATMSEKVYSVEEMAAHHVHAAMESRVWDDLHKGSPAVFAAYLVRVTADVGANTAPVRFKEQEGPEEGFEQPEIRVGDDTSVFTRLTDPHNPTRVAAVLDAVTIGPDLTTEQRRVVEEFVVEFADCYALSMKEVMPIPGAEHTMNIPSAATFSTKVH
jgi:hypothetical protein